MRNYKMMWWCVDPFSNWTEGASHLRASVSTLEGLRSCDVLPDMAGLMFQEIITKTCNLSETWMVDKKHGKNWKRNLAFQLS